MLEKLHQHKFRVTQVCIQYDLQKYLEKGQQRKFGRSARFLQLSFCLIRFSIKLNKRKGIQEKAVADERSISLNVPSEAVKKIL